MSELNDLDLNLCKIFLSVAKLGSISKAAETLYVSQPAISYNIKMLEERLNCKLFNRTPKGVEPTAEALKLMYYIENAYNILETGFKMLNDSQDLLEGEIRIGVPTHICNFFVSDVIELFSKQYPGIKFSIVNKSTAEMVDMLEKRAIDIIIDSYPIDSKRGDITIIELLNIENCFVASNKYSNLLVDNKRLSIKELYQYPLLLQPKKTSTRKILENEFASEFNNVNPNIEVATTEVMLDLVKRGLGIGYFALMSVLDLIESGELIEIPVKEDLPTTKICMAYIDEFLTNAPKKFKEIMKEKSNMLNALKKKAIRLVLLQDCVYNCSFCHKEGIKDKRESKLSPKDIAYMYKTLNKNYGMKTVHLTGGEPLLKQDIKEIIEKLKKEDAIIKITTNGFLLKENMWIGEMVDKLNISIHSINEEKYESISHYKKSFKTVIDSVKELRFRYPTLKISINTTLIKNINDNIEDIEDIIRFSSSVKSDLKILEIYPKNVDEYTNIENVIPIIKKLGYKHINNSFRKSIYSNGSHNVILQKCTCSAISEEKDKNNLCKVKNDLFITQDGKLNLCRNTDESIDLYNSIKNRNDKELAELIKISYEKMGNECNC